METQEHDDAFKDNMELAREDLQAAVQRAIDAKVHCASYSFWLE